MDGTKIIFQKYQDDNWDIFEYNISAQSTKQITFNAAHEEHPAYSSDLRTIAYTSTRDDHRGVDYNQKLRDLYVMDLVTGRQMNLTTNSSNDWRPRFSRDGNFITFVSERSDLRVPWWALPENPQMPIPRCAQGARRERRRERGRVFCSHRTKDSVVS